MSIRSQKKRLTLIFKKNYLHTFHHYMKQSSTISFNKSPREAFKNLFTKSFDPRIIRLFLIDNIQLQLLSFLSLYKLHFHITRSLFNNSSRRYRETSKTCYTSYQIFQFTNYPTISIDDIQF